MKKNLIASFILLSVFSGVYFSCSKGGDSTDSPSNPCSNFSVNLSASATSGTPCSSPANGSITVTATGGTGLIYSINGTSFQASNVFSNVAPGNYTVTVKNSSGCTQTASVTVGSNPAGPLFAAVKQIIQSNCLGCHSGANPIGGKDWSVDCNVVASATTIKTRTVDQAGTANQMPKPPNPALSAADQQKITDWVNAGGRYTD